MERKLIRVGTRGSRLALTQTAIVIEALRTAHPNVEFEPVVVKTQGDSNRSASISSLGVGVFVKALEDALEDGRIDMAVHSLKDLTSVMPPGFRLAAVPGREDPRDVLVSRQGGGLAGLPQGARVATGSTRRQALALDARPDLAVEPVRGNVETRMAKVQENDGPNAVILAAAGLARLGHTGSVSEFLDPETFVPAVGQGALAVEIRDDDNETRRYAAAIDDLTIRAAVEAERSFLAAIGGGCLAPTSAYATGPEGKLRLNAFASDAKGRRIIRGSDSGDERDAEEIGRRLAIHLLDQGADELLEPFRERPNG
ncbi:MAG: hydroxymethylbilane synthase [Dehalococcoidia bacterium]